MADTCRFCGHPADDHFVVIRNGVAHTGVYEGDRRILCSLDEASRHFMFGEIWALQTIVRSLRYRAGRLRNAGRTWTHEHVNEYADKVARDRESLIGYEQRYYSPTKKGG